MTHDIVSLSFYRFDTSLSKLWAFAMMGLARLPMARNKNIGFWKLFGSGSGEGFSPRPNTKVYAILATWSSLEAAKSGTQSGSVFSRYRAQADESWSVYLAPVSCKGQWSGTDPFLPASEPVSGPLAALTRATVKPSVALKFWGKVPNISQAIGTDQNVAFKIGLGEVPWLQQVTFSIWPSAPAMANFARKDGPHAHAIKAVRDGQWFKEELYARFKLLGDHGTWNGTRPLAQLEIHP